MTDKSLTFWIDNDKYATVQDSRRKKGRVALYMEDVECMLYRPMIQAIDTD
jgi:hypothetical protein